jgi:uncharacterized protein YbjT (DUF2867 family)
VKVLIAGATGFIGARLAAALRSRGHEVSAAARPAVDYSRALRVEDWSKLVAGMDAVVNAVGILRERGTQTFDRVHDAAPRALFSAGKACGVRKVVQISALGADHAARSRFHLSKKRADDFLAALPLDWVIVQPSLVFGPGGASARWLAMLAALPWVPLPGAGTQRVQPIHIDDLTELLVRVVEDASIKRRVIAAVGPRGVSLREWLEQLRAQMGFRPARFVRVPLRMVPMGRETLGMLERGNTAPADGTIALLGRPPRDIVAFIPDGKGAALRARLDWLLPVLRGSVAVVWIWSGAVSFGLYPAAESLVLLERAGVGGVLGPPVLYGAAALDVAFGVATLLMRRGRRWLWRAQLATIVAYSAIVALRLPELWLHPFGPLIKNLPMLAAIVLLLHLEERR